MTDVTNFSHAILREPGKSAIYGLRDVDRGSPDIEGLRAEHAAYQRTLGELGVRTTLLPSLEAYPDALFVEDPALVFPEGAVLLRPGAPSRQGEGEKLLPVLEDLFPEVIRLSEGTAEGGDVLVTDKEILIGRTSRTDDKGSQALAEVLAVLGRPARIVAPPADVLHFKTACSLIGPDTVLATQALLSGGDFFGGLRVVEVPAGEEAAANALSVNGTVLIAEGFPATASQLLDMGFRVRALKLDEVMKLDAGLSCMSLRWLSGRKGR